MRLLILVFLFEFIQCKIWNKNYLTWSLVNGTNYSFLSDIITLWDIKPLEFSRVAPGKGDINIYFAPMKNEAVLGYAYYPETGSIYINNNISSNLVFYVLQHEIGHALGLPHDLNNGSVMFPFLTGSNVSNYDRQKLYDLYKCSFDSSTLINFYTYLMFSGSHYQRLDFNSMEMSSDKMWLPFLRNVDSMYRNESGSYIIISNDKFYELDTYLRLIRYDHLKYLFPNVKFVDAVLKLRNHSLFVFSGNYVNNRHISEKFNPYPNNNIRGAFENKKGYVFLVDRDYLWRYDKDFNFIKRVKLCKHKYFSKIHCCLNN